MGAGSISSCERSFRIIVTVPLTCNARRQPAFDRDLTNASNPSVVKQALTLEVEISISRLEVRQQAFKV